jgi:hypothetical protein
MSQKQRERKKMNLVSIPDFHRGEEIVHLTNRQIKREGNSLVFVQQDPHVTKVEFDGQVVDLQFTNACMEVALRKIDGKWVQVDRWFRGSPEDMTERRGLFVDTFMSTA